MPPVDHAMDFKHRPDTDFRAIDALDPDQAAEEAAALREGINYHDYRYYVRGDPEISDAVYDRLFARLQDLEEAFPDVRTDDSPTRRVGAEPVSELEKVEHSAPMLSLQATLERDEIAHFLESVAQDGEAEFGLEPKFDGLSVELVYESGHFRRGATRGNGDVGEDISHNLKTIGAVPLVLRDADDAPAELAVRGEVYMPKSGFTELNRRRVERGDDPFANPRNAAAGLMRQQDSREVAGKPLDVCFYDVLACSDALPDSHADVLGRLDGWGLKTSPEEGRGRTIDDVADYHERLAERRDDLDYEIDGVVIKLDDRPRRDELGTRQASPRWAMAWKFAPREEVTRVEDIVVQVGRTGKLTPVALLQPVDVGGVTVSRATLHNADEVERKDVRVGDEVRIKRAGDVIPEVEERIPHRGRKRHDAFAMPEQCPVCGAPVVREGAYHLCSAGLSCPAQLAASITHYGARNAMDIDQLGERTAVQLVDAGLVHDLADLYSLETAQIADLEGFAEHSARQLREAIQDADRPRLDVFLFALGIRHVGRRVARDLATHFRTLDALEKADREAVAQISGIGPEIAEAVADFFANDENRDVLARLAEAGVEVQPMPERRERPLAGKTFVFTGTLAGYTRDEAKDRVEALGGRATSQVSGETDIVVVGEDPGSKAEDAREQGVERIDEDAFRKLIEED